jgi:hypothetical protein
MLVGQLPRTYRSLPRPNLMTPRHPPRALRSLTTPIGPPQSMLLAAKRKHPKTAIFTTGFSCKIEDFQPGVSRREGQVPTSFLSIRKGSQFELPVASS